MRYKLKDSLNRKNKLSDNFLEKHLKSKGWNFEDDFAIITAKRGILTVKALTITDIYLKIQEYTLWKKKQNNSTK